ncbi:hypothetical protein [Sphingobium sp.]|uniref:hypothetical protein n=1 Tax=Sphingobium sp. TaxID=1912891 RepID=UPI0026328A6C|nr:hypothetical protein [Sphingobium sp.]
MRGLVKLAIVTGLGAFAVKGWRDWMGDGKDAGIADMDEMEAAGLSGYIRDAGPQQGISPRDWDKVDEQSDESFPASDPPGNF